MMYRYIQNCKTWIIMQKKLIFFPPIYFQPSYTHRNQKYLYMHALGLIWNEETLSCFFIYIDFANIRLIVWMSIWNEKIEGKKSIKTFFNGMDKILLKPSFNNQKTLPIFMYPLTAVSSSTYMHVQWGKENNFHIF